jgi:hypothetical protein
MNDLQTLAIGCFALAAASMVAEHMTTFDKYRRGHRFERYFFMLWAFLALLVDRLCGCG